MMFTLPVVNALALFPEMESTLGLLLVYLRGSPEVLVPESVGDVPT